LTGTVPAFVSNNPVRKYHVDLSFNKFDSLVAFHADPSLAIIVNNNKLDFTNILKVARPVQQYIYIPQDTIVFPSGQVTNVKAYVGDSLILTTTIDKNTSTPSQYQWFKYVDGVHDIPLTQPSTTGNTFIDSLFSSSQAGKYYYKITNPAAPGLSLVSPFITVTVSPCVTDIPLYFTFRQYICAFQFSPPSNTINCKSVSYRWNFGDSTSSSLKNPIHGFKSAGTYNVSLSLSFKCGTACLGDTVIQRQVTFDPNANSSFFRDSLVQISSDVRSKILSASMTTFADAWPLQHASQALSDKSSFLNGTRGVWRNEGNYVYKVDRNQSTNVDLAKDGTFNMQSFNWQQAGFDVIPNWIKTNTMTQYSPFSYELENKDVLGVYSAALYDYGGHLPSANGVNMRNNEMAFTSFEYLDGNVTGNWIFGTNPVPTYSFYDVKTGFNSVAIIAKPISQLQQFPEATVISRRFGVPSFYFFYYFNYIQNDSVVCRQQYPGDASRSVVVFQQGPFPGIWTGAIAVRNTVLPIVTPDIDNSISHSGKSSLRISTTKSFKQNLLQLDSGKQYHVNAWVSVNNPNVTTPKLADGLGFSVVVRNSKDQAKATFSFVPSGPIIEGWQQVKGTFTCPINNSTLELVFNQGSTGQAWYDDLRLHPELGNMKAYVYDLNDYSLRATLDEENFGSFYFYDKEGKLYLVKKETEKGIKTISENVNYIVERK
jgi:PKD repeat protein